jgi:RHS repeat-associated protein
MPRVYGLSGLDERLYYLQDANYNVTALVQGTPNHQDIGKVVERYAYDPYGRATVLDGETATDWAVDSGGSDWDNRVLFCGYRFDAETGLYHVRRRMYHSTYGRWLQRDPLGYVDGMGLYAYCGGRPCVASDPSGEILRVKFRNEPNRRYIEKLLQKMDPRVRVDSQGGVSIASTDRPKEGGGSGSLDGGLLEDLIRSDHTHTIQTGSGRSRCDATDPAGALDPNRGSGSTITLNPDDRTLLPRKMADGSTQSAQSTDYEKMEHEVIHAVHYDEGGVVEGDIAYSDLECTDRSAPAEEVRTIGCSGEPITGTKLSDITANDLIRARNRREGKADIEEGVYVGVGKEVRRW